MSYRDCIDGEQKAYIDADDEYFLISGHNHHLISHHATDPVIHSTNII